MFNVGDRVLLGEGIGTLRTRQEYIVIAGPLVVNGVHGITPFARLAASVRSEYTKVASGKRGTTTHKAGCDPLPGAAGDQLNVVNVVILDDTGTPGHNTEHAGTVDKVQRTCEVVYRG